MTVCRALIAIFAVLYLLAVLLLIIGTFGLFGQEHDPLSGVFLIPLGVPWVYFFGSAPEELLPWLAVIAPSVNLGILVLICRWRSMGR